MRTLVLAVVLAAALPAAAAERPAPSPRTVIRFGEGDVIDGRLGGPDVEQVDARPHAVHPSLLRVRESFREDVIRSSAEL